MDSETIVLPALVGVFLPFVIDLVNRFIPKYEHRALIALGFSILVGVIINFTQLWPINTEDLTPLFVGITASFTTAKLVYDLWWKNSDSRERVLTAYEDGLKLKKK